MLKTVKYVLKTQKAKLDLIQASFQAGSFSRLDAIQERLKVCLFAQFFFHLILSQFSDKRTGLAGGFTVGWINPRKCFCLLATIKRKGLGMYINKR